MILLSKTETLFASTHVSYPTPQKHGNKINECTSREYLTKYKVYYATNIKEIPSYYLILRRPRHDPPPFLLISRIVKTVILMLRQKLNVKHQVTNEIQNLQFFGSLTKFESYLLCTYIDISFN